MQESALLFCINAVSWCFSANTLKTLLQYFRGTSKKKRKKGLLHELCQLGSCLITKNLLNTKMESFAPPTTTINQGLFTVSTNPRNVTFQQSIWNFLINTSEVSYLHEKALFPLILKKKIGWPETIYFHFAINFLVPPSFPPHCL